MDVVDQTKHHAYDYAKQNNPPPAPNCKGSSSTGTHVADADADCTEAPGVEAKVEAVQVNPDAAANTKDSYLQGDPAYKSEVGRTGTHVAEPPPAYKSEVGRTSTLVAKAVAGPVLGVAPVAKAEAETSHLHIINKNTV